MHPCRVTPAVNLNFGPAAGGAGRRLLQVLSNTSVIDANISGVLPLIPAASSAFNASDNTTTTTYFIPLSLFSLNCNRPIAPATTASQWSLGPLIIDQRVQAVINTVQGEANSVNEPAAHHGCGLASRQQSWAQHSEVASNAQVHAPSEATPR